MRAESAVGWPALAPALICLVKRVEVSSQRVAAPSGCGMGDDAKVLPEFGERAEDGRLGDLFAELRGEVVGGHAGCVVFGAFGKESVGVEGERRDLAGSAGGGGLLPCLVATEGEDVGEG